ncbi:hypothetical protein AZL_001240 [Azospirillum sp. B510]|uniref:tubulin-like doman-containing protein n=1 Tax=Azospirillum sp. (strain B510) TaxID=137722 RepID=UPI0001C4B986|nr:tubulin-like doman-containing protein [Azospirillum sp. B510]BAI70762.1 hypothetical protein AZL_001240 [Azospirillum sp. B510]
MAHVLIGLGATGGHALTAFRRIAEQDAQTEQPVGPDVSYLIVEAATDVAGAAPISDWLRSGTFLPEEFLLVHPSSLKHGAPRMPGHHFSRALYERVERAMRDDDDRHLAALCAQSRRLGRLLLACNAPSFMAALDRAVDALPSLGGAPLTFHIVYGLGEGPGGGLIEAVAGIRMRWRDPKRARIVVYARMPDPDDSGDDTAAAALANAYAAMVELQAIVAGEIGAADFTFGETGVDQHAPLNAAYLFGGSLENGQPLSADDVHEAAAQFLRQRIAIDRGDVDGKRLRQLEDSANGFGAGRFPWSDGGAMTVLAFGSKRLVSPEPEIREALVLSFARAGLLQLLHNNWRDGAGFVDEPPESPGGTTWPRDAESRWLISEDHLLLSQAFLPQDLADKRWRSISDEWSSVMEGFKDMARLQERPKWLDTLIALCHRRYAEDFRGVGVANFYRSRYMETVYMAAMVRASIERDLIDGWKDGRWSLGELAGIVDSLIAAQEDRLAAIPERVARIRGSEDETRARIIGVFQKWAALGRLARLSGKCEQILDECVIQLHELNVKMTRAEAWAFAGQLLPAILTELQNLRSIIESVTRSVADAVNALDQRLDRLGDVLEAMPNAYAPVVRLFNRDRVRGIAAATLTDERVQRHHVATMRDAMIGDLGPEQGFHDLLERFNGPNLTQTIRQIGQARIDDAHASHMGATGERVLRLTVFDQIRDMYGGDPAALRSFFDTILSATHCFAELTEPAAAQARRQFALLPRGAKQEAFSKQVRAGIRASAGSEIEFLETDQGPFEIGIVTIQTIPSLSRFTNLAAYDTAYQTRLFADTATAFYDMHTVSNATDLKPLTVQGGERQKEKAAGFTLPHLLIGVALGHVFRRKGDALEPDRYLLVPKDADGLDEEPILLGEDLLQSCDRLVPSTTALLCANNTLTLSAASPEQREDWLRSVVSLVNRVKADRGNDPVDPIYRKFVDAARTATQMIRGDHR